MNSSNDDVIPSHLAVEHTTSTQGDSYFGNLALIPGEVVDVIYADDSRSYTGLFTEYNVLIQNRYNGTGNGELLQNVLAVNLFGGLTDYFNFTFRKSDEAPSNQDNGYSNGSKVLILFIHGEGSKPYIIGGFRDPQDNTESGTKGKGLGHHMAFQFNGLAADIDDDGALTVTFNGATTNDGDLDTDKVDNDAIGTNFSIDKDGNATLATKDDDQHIQIDHKNKKILIKQNEAFELGDATDKMLLGESFRNSQKQMNNKIKSYLTSAKTQLQNAGTQLQTAGGSIAGPFMAAAAGPNLTSAGALILAASQLMGQAAQAISDFENDASQKNSFLSKKNSSD